MKSALFLLILLNSLRVSSQIYTELADSLVRFTASNDKPQKIKALNKSDSSWLMAGYYKLQTKEADRSFQVGDSGLLQGSFFHCYSAKSCMETVYEKGVQVHSYLKSGGNILEESYDSLVNVMQYNSKKNKWESQLKLVTVDKTYDPAGRLFMLRYAKGPYDAYATYKYTRGVLISENIPHYLDKKWSPTGQLYEETIFNWTSKQTEIFRYEKGLLTEKMILENPANFWSPKGRIEYSTNPNAHFVTTLFTYAEGKRIIKKEVEEPGKRTVTEYDAKGKVVFQKTYPRAKPEMGTDVVAPVEVQQ